MNRRGLREEEKGLSGELEQTVATIFETMLELQVAPVATAWPVEPNPVTATVHFAGSWSGVLMLEVGPSLACHCAGRFLSTDVPPAVDNDVKDVLGELANMIGGNLKCALAPGALLSLPEVIEGSDFRVRICTGAVTEQQAFTCDAGVFRVSLIQMRPDGAVT